MLINLKKIGVRGGHPSPQVMQGVGDSYGSFLTKLFVSGSFEERHPIS